jgi:hypothetical protein
MDLEAQLLNIRPHTWTSPGSNAIRRLSQLPRRLERILAGPFIERFSPLDNVRLISLLNPFTRLDIFDADRNRLLRAVRSGSMAR